MLPFDVRIEDVWVWVGTVGHDPLYLKGDKAYGIGTGERYRPSNAPPLRGGKPMRTQPITLTAVGALLVGVAACLDVADMASPTSDPEPRLDGQSSEWPPPGYVPFTLHGWMTGELGREYTREDVEEMGYYNAELLLFSTLLAKRERELEELLAQPDAYERTTRYGLNMVEALKSDIRANRTAVERARRFTNRFAEPESDPEPLASQECLDEPEISSFFGSPNLRLEPSTRAITVRGSASHLTTENQKHYIGDKWAPRKIAF